MWTIPDFVLCFLKVFIGYNSTAFSNSPWTNTARPPLLSSRSGRANTSRHSPGFVLSSAARFYLRSLDLPGLVERLIKRVLGFPLVPLSLFLLCECSPCYWLVLFSSREVSDGVSAQLCSLCSQLEECREEWENWLARACMPALPRP